MVYSLHHKAIKTHFVFLYVGCSLMKSVWWRWWPDGGCRVSLSAPLCHTLLYITHRLLIRVITDVISLSVIHTLCLFLTLIFITLYCKDNHSKQLYLYLCLKNITSSSYRHFFFGFSLNWQSRNEATTCSTKRYNQIRWGFICHKVFFWVLNPTWVHLPFTENCSNYNSP